MKINYLLSLMLPLMLCGCENTLTKQHSKALNKLKTVNADQLILECKVLLEDSKGKEVYSLPRESWPPSIKKIDPLMVQLSGDCFSVSLALEKGLGGHEMGIQVIPSEPSDYSSEAPTFIRKQMISHIYWYAE